MSGQYRNWCITLCNPRPGAVIIWGMMRTHLHQDVSFLVFQSEIGDGTDAVPIGTPHYQAYVEFKRPKRLRGVKRIFGPRIHAERRLGTQAQAIAYCEKLASRDPTGLSAREGVPKRARGQPKGAFSVMVRKMADGATLEEVEDESPETMVMYRDKLVDYHLRKMGHRDWAMEIEIYVGVSGTGKSTTAKLDNPGAYHGDWPKGGRWWWPGYCGQECVILDEFRHQIKMDLMMNVMDRHTMHLEAKGRSFEMVSKKLIITTNIDPCDWYPGVPFAAKDPLQRRIREFAEIYDFAPGHGFDPDAPGYGFFKVQRPNGRRFTFSPDRDVNEYGN